MHPHMNKIQEAIERLQECLNDTTVTDVVIENSENSGEEFSQLLHCQDAWFDIYGHGVKEEYWYYEQEEMFGSDWYHNSILPIIEEAIWINALKRHNKLHWIKYLEP
jgi:hypothetical protein